MTSTEKILSRKFEESRIVCWRDRKEELLEEFHSLNLPGVEKIEVRNNEFAVLYRVLRLEPEKKFLIFIPGAEPPPEENWLLDLEVTYDAFLADQTSLWLGELGLGYEFASLAEMHREFLSTAKNRSALRKLLSSQENERSIRMKMLAIVAESDCRIDAVLEALMEEVAAGENSKFANLEKSRLADFFWGEVKAQFGYQSKKPAVKDFVVRLFRGGFLMAVDPDCPPEERLASEALVFLRRFKDSRRHAEAFERCSEIAAQTLDLADLLAKRGSEELGSLDCFKQIDRRILCDLVARVLARTIPAADCSSVVRLRRQTFWYPRLQHAYLAVDFAAQFLQTLENTTLSVDSIPDGVARYTGNYCRLDRLYRKFIFHASAANQHDLLADLRTRVENFYANRYLLTLGNLWQEKIDTLSRWELPGVTPQSRFFELNIEPILTREKKVFVIISDALRYEIATELAERLESEDRYRPELQAAFSMLPSYTALGMAALLPHRELTLKAVEKNTIAVLADGMNTQGADGRAKVLAARCPRSAILSARELAAMQKETGRTFFREHDVAYIYHNVIDQIGDDKMTETQTCAAAETAMEEIITLVKKLTAFNATTIIVTADHGFLYQNEELPVDDFLSDEPGGDVVKQGRRYVIGKNLKAADGLRKFLPEELGFQSDLEIQIPKSINRLRLQGAGSRYVHGGATLQEVIIPILTIHKKREGDTSQVDVEIISGMSVITSGQLAITCYQRQSVGGKILPRRLVAGLFSQTGELISDERELLFDFSAADPRDRELTCGLVLSHEAEKYNGQEVILKLRELESGTTVYKDYQTRRFQLRRQLMDLDF